MTFAPITDAAPILILGTDAVLAALPATPVQLAHACLRAGFTDVIPPSWGDELIAAAALCRLPAFGNGPVIHCSCPIVAQRLLAVGNDLRPVMLALVAAPVATARYLRSLWRASRPHITYVGSCPGAVDESIDVRMTPDALLAMLVDRGIVLGDQPRRFESTTPPDPRRFCSQPGGVPTADALRTELAVRTIVEITSDDFVAEIAQHLLTGKRVLIDASARLGCACRGAAPGQGTNDPRAQMITLEPPRSASPVVEAHASIELDVPLPAPPPPSSDDVRRAAFNLPVVAQPVPDVLPKARVGDGTSGRPAYVPRRRSPAKSIAAAVEPLDWATEAPPVYAPMHGPIAPAATLEPLAALPALGRAATAPEFVSPNPVRGPAVVSAISRGQLVFILLGVAVLTVLASTVVSVIVGRSVAAALHSSAATR